MVDIIRIHSCGSCPFAFDERDDGGPLSCLHPRVELVRDTTDTSAFELPGETLPEWELEGIMQRSGFLPMCDDDRVPGLCPLVRHGACVMALEGQGIELGTVQLSVPPRSPQSEES